MFIIHIISFLVILVAAGYLFRVSLGDMLPFVWCGLILVLYFLAFGRALNLIDILMPLAALALLGYIVVKKQGRKLAGYAGENLAAAPFVVYILLCLILPICMKDKIVTWWDDINYWASDLKSLYYLNGFASKYANVSPSFGDYPPGVQLAKWYLVHMDRTGFREDLAFDGYYLFNLSFLMPLFRNIKGKKTWLALPLAAVVWLFAGMGEIYGYAGFCADLSMAMLFGSLLYMPFDGSLSESRFGKIACGLYLAVLVLVKSTGSIWALFAIIILVVTGLIKKKRITFRGLARELGICIPPLISGGAWMAFCLYRHRVTQTTSTMVTYVTTDKYGLSEYTGQFAGAFVKAMFTEPLHVDRTWIDLPPAAIFALLCVAFFLIYKKGYLTGTAGRFTCICLPVMGLAYYGAIFLAHMTIFGTETQYLEASAMIASIERYGAPFMLGSMLFIARIWMDGNFNDRQLCIHALVLTAAVCLLTDFPAVWDGLTGYRSHLEEDKEYRQGFIDDSSREFLNVLEKALPDGNTRVCRLRDGGYYRVADTYTAYEASPVSLMSISYDLDTLDAGTLIGAVSQTHAVYLYADEQDGDKSILDEMTEDHNFRFCTLYRISYEGGTMVLYPVEVDFKG